MSASRRRLPSPLPLSVSDAATRRLTLASRSEKTAPPSEGNGAPHAHGGCPAENGAGRGDVDDPGADRLVQGDFVGTLPAGNLTRDERPELAAQVVPADQTRLH